MPPRPSCHNSIDRATCHAKLLTENTLLATLKVKFAYLAYLFFCQLDLRMLFPARLALLVHHVGIIVAASTGPNVIRVYARTIVALVTGYFAFRERLTVVDFPRNSTGYTAFAAIMNRAIASAVRRALPHPTIGKCAYRTIRPEIIFNGVIPRRFQAVHRPKSKKVSPVIFFSSVVALGEFGRLSAAALTNAIGGKQSIFGNPLSIVFEVFGKVRHSVMIGVHENLHSLAKSLGRLHPFRAVSIGFYSFNYSTNGLFAACQFTDSRGAM